MLFMLLAVEATNLHLVCPGQGLDTKVGIASAQAYANDGSRAALNVYQRKAAGFDDQLEIEVVDGAGRVRLPSRVVPPIHGGKDGWYDVKGLQVGQDTIEGKVPVNFTNAPRLHISRITGIVTIEGRDGSFTGKCQAYDPANVKRAF